MGDTDAERLAKKEAREGVKLKRNPNPASADADEINTASGKRIKVTDEEFAVMLEKAGGFKSRLAKQLGITVGAVCHRIQRSAYLKEACKTIEETVLDLAEAGLIKAAQNGEPWAITFILKCKGRKRGWIERQDLAFGGDPDALPPPIVLQVHDAAFIEAERERQKKEFDELADAALIELAPTPEAGGEKIEGAADGGTWAPVGGDGGAAEEATSDGKAEGAPQTAENAPGADARPENGNAGTGGNGGAKEPRVPRTPSEAAAMRREQEAKERAANGTAQGARQAAQPYRAVPVMFPRR